MRRFIAIMVIALHMLLVWLLALGFRPRFDRVTEQPRLVSQWINLPAVILEPLPVRKPPPVTTQPRQEAEQPPPVAPTAPVAPVTVPLEPAVPESQPESLAPVVVPTPPVDFARAAREAVRNRIEAEVAAEQKGGNITPPPKTLAKPCVPRERSMEFKGNGDGGKSEEPGLHWVGPIPVVVTRHCAFTLTAFACGFGKKPEANGHLLDDMQDPTLSRSSVPDPNQCD